MADAEVPLFKSDSVVITQSIARFGQASYQIANIGSVMLIERRQWGALASVLLVGGAVALLSGMGTSEKEPSATWLIIAGIACLVGGLVSQNRWPSLEYTLSLKTSSGDIQALQSQNIDEIAAVKRALEEAFSKRKGL